MEASTTTEKAVPKILLLENSQGAFERIRSSIREEIECDFVRVAYPAAFEAALNRDEFDLVICNCSVMGSDGLSALKQVKSVRPEVSVIVVSDDHGSNGGESIKLGATDYLLKQLTDQLAPTVLRALEQSKDRQERRRAEKARREIEERLHLLLKNSKDVFWFVELDPERIVFVSPAVESIWGAPPERFYKEPSFWLEAILPEDRKIAEEVWEVALSGKTTSYESEFRVVRPDGEIRWVQEISTINRDEADKPKSISGIARDITAHKEAEAEIHALNQTLEQRVSERTAELDAAREQLATTLRSMGDGLLSTDVEGRVTRLNPEAEKLIGMSQEDALGRPISEVFRIFDEATGERSLIPVGEILANKETNTLPDHTVLLSHDETERIIESTLAPIRNHNGQILGIVLVFSDATEIRKRDQALRESEESLRDLFDNSNDLIQSVSLDDRILLANQAWRTTLGYSESEIEALSIVDIVHPDSLEHYRDFKRRLRAGEKVGVLEVSFRTKNGRRIDLEGNISIRSENGKVVATRGIYRDVTQRKRAEAELQRSRELLEYAMHVANMADWEFDFDSKTLVLNDRYFALCGTSIEREGGYEIPVDRYLRDFCLPDAAPVIEKAIKEGIDNPDTKRVFEIQYRMRRRDSGETRHTTCRYRITCDRRGRAIRAAGSHQDVTDRKLAEAKLQHIRAQLEDAMEAANMADWEFDFQSNFLTLNDRFFALLGTTAALEEGYQVPIEDYAKEFCHPEDIPVIEKAVKDGIANPDTSRVFGIQYRLRRRDSDELRHVSVRYKISCDEAGRASKAVGSLQDITELKRAEEEVRHLNENLERLVDERTGELQASERRFRATFNQAAVGIAHVSTEGRFLRFNQRFCKLVGYPSRELMEMTYQELTHPDDLEADLENSVLLFSGQIDSFEMEKRYIRKDGSTIWIDLSASVVRDANGEIEYAVGIIADITERKRAQAALDESERFARASLNALSSHLAVLDEHGEIIATNIAWDRFAAENGGDSELVGKGANYLQVCDEAKGHLSEDAPVAARGIRGVIAGRIPEFLLEYRCDSREEQRWFVCRATRFPGDGPIRVVVAHENITRIRTVQAALNEQQELSRITLENVMDGVIVCDQDYELTLFNRAAREWHGVDPRGISVEERSQFYHLMEGDGVTPLPRDQAPLHRAMQGEVVSKTSMAIVRENGPTYFIECDAVPLRDSSGALRGAVAVLHDVTEQRRWNNVLQQSLKEKETLLKEIHHRVKNNLQIVTSLLDLQIDTTPGKSLKKPLLESANRVRAMATIHERLYRSSSLARIDFGEYAEVLSTALFRSYAVKGQVEFVVDADTVELGIETAVPCGLILNELISNACKHAFSKGGQGRLEVSLRRKDRSGFVLTVKDTGPGLPDGFDIRQSGALGLQLVETLVRQINGQLEVHNRDGACFQLSVESTEGRK